MGNEFVKSTSELRTQLESYRVASNQQRQRDIKLFKSLDERTKVPHLLIELRSLGFVEICGKDTGGIYERLAEWLEVNWNTKPATHESREDIFSGCAQCCYFNAWCTDCCCSCPFIDYINLCGICQCWCTCDCCGDKSGTLVMMEQRPLLDHDRLCDANFAMQTPPTSEPCKTLALCECDRHYPVCCWYAQRYFCNCCVPKPPVFKRRGFNGESNMGKLTMQLVNFMTNECGWSLVLCNGTNLGFYGDIREQQIKFAAPHPLNLVAPHIMIELRSVGFIEINGHDTNDIHAKLEDWMAEKWKARRVKADPEYCDVKFKCSAFKRRGFEGENNMGQRTMELVDFMTLTCAWTLIACNGGNFGRRGDWREQQLVFRNDDHVQHGEDHIMVELRDVANSGYIEVNGVNSSPGIEDALDGYLRGNWGCDPYMWGRYEAFCDRKYKTPANFYYRSNDLTNNLGKRTIELATFMASQGWLLMLCNGGAITEMRSLHNRLNARSLHFPVGEEFVGKINREQQVKFTKARPGEKADSPLLMIELRAVPRDPDVENIPYCLGPRCVHEGSKSEREANDREWDKQTADRRQTRREEVRSYLRADYIGWHEHQKKGPMDRYTATFQPYQLQKWKSAAQTTKPECAIIQGLIEVNGPNTNHVYEKLEQFITGQMRGGRINGKRPYCDALFECNVLRMKRVPFPATVPEVDGYYLGENNFGVYTMRLCDFLVDHLGEWDLVVCNGNAFERAWKVDRDRAISICAREQQLVFRHRSVRRNVFMAKAPVAAKLGRPPLNAPSYWTEATSRGDLGHKLVQATTEEQSWMQTLLDGTFKKTKTRDRKDAMANRFVAVAAMRSEHPALWDRYAQRRKDVVNARRDPENYVVPKTMSLETGLVQRCADASNKNLANEAYLFHGTNPTSALAILGTSFKVDFAGGAAGTMFGAGVYLAEASTKSDEYAADDVEGAYKGLFAMLICRAVVGAPFITEKPGDYVRQVQSGSFDCVLGDREKAVGTYREFIFFHESSIYPEYVIFYKRDYGDTVAGSHTASPTIAKSHGVKVDPKICRYFAAGHCRNGDKCRFTHAVGRSSAAPSPIPATTVGVAATPPGQMTMGGGKQEKRWTLAGMQ